MLRDVIRKEIMDNISTLKFVVTFAVVIVLVISGLVIGSRNYIELKGDAQEQVKLNQRLMESQFNYSTAAGIGILESKKPYVLTTVDNGIEGSLGRQSYINFTDQPFLDESRNLVSPILAVFGDVDLTFVVKIILSLFVILLTYDAISGEKERGTLKLSLANEVPRHVILLGKILGGFAVIAVSFVVPLVIGLVFMMGFYPQVLADFNVEAWGRLLLILAVYVIYLAVFFALGLMVSSFTHRSSTSFIVLLMVWVVFVTIVPRLSVTAAERAKPHESYATVQAQIYKKYYEDRTSIWKEQYEKTVNEKMAKLRQLSVAGAFGGNEELRNQLQQAQNELREIILDFYYKTIDMRQAIADDFLKDYMDKQSEQIGFAKLVSRSFSPASALSFAVQNLAGSGWARQEAYIDQLREFQKGFRAFMDVKMKEEARQQTSDPMAGLTKRTLEIPISNITFKFREESLAEVLARSMWDIGVLVVLAIVFFAASFVAFLRYDVR